MSVRALAQIGTSDDVPDAVDTLVFLVQFGYYLNEGDRRVINRAALTLYRSALCRFC